MPEYTALSLLAIHSSNIRIRTLNFHPLFLKMVTPYYSHMFQTAQARVAEAMDGAFSFLQKQENKA